MYYLYCKIYMDIYTAYIIIIYGYIINLIEFKLINNIYLLYILYYQSYSSINRILFIIRSILNSKVYVDL